MLSPVGTVLCSFRERERWGGQQQARTDEADEELCHPNDRLSTVLGIVPTILNMEASYFMAGFVTREGAASLSAWAGGRLLLAEGKGHGTRLTLRESVDRHGSEWRELEKVKKKSKSSLSINKRETRTPGEERVKSCSGQVRQGALTGDQAHHCSWARWGQTRSCGAPPRGRAQDV